MTTHRYIFQALIPEYVRAGVGVAMTAGPVLLIDAIAPVAWALGKLGFPKLNRANVSKTGLEGFLGIAYYAR